MNRNIVRLAIFTVCYGLCGFTGVAWAQSTVLKLEDPLPLDKHVVSGVLPNGLKYYIRKNSYPLKRAELRLAVNAGSLLETDDQQGLAHFAEHMCFNGTKKYPKQALVNFLERLGVGFGPDLNAYTSFDETVYMLKVPTDSAGMLAKGIDILREWAGEVVFEADEIDKERGVVIEEWRLGQGAGSRLRQKTYPVVYKNSQYAKRLPIGQKAVLDTFKHDRIRKYYKDWYRPNLMAVVAVGDFDVVEVEKEIKARFSTLQNPPNAPARTVFDVPPHPETNVVVATDPEAPYANFYLMVKHPARELKTVADYRRYGMLPSLFNGMYNARLYELSLQGDSPFTSAYATTYNFPRTVTAFVTGCSPKDGQEAAAIEAVLVEMIRVKQHGFTLGELERMKKQLLANLEKAYLARNTTESDNYTDELVSYFLENQPVPGVEYEYELYKTYINGITLAEVNALASELILETNRTAVLTAREQNTDRLPKSEAILDLLRKLSDVKLPPYVDNYVEGTLLPQQPKPGEISKIEELPSLKAQAWTLSNGVKVIAKQTDFQADEVLVYAQSPGGFSVCKPEDDMTALHAARIMSMGGIGKLSLAQKNKKLQGVNARLNPYVDRLSEGVSGSATPKDLGVLFQLIYGAFTAPRLDTSAFRAYIDDLKDDAQAIPNSPEMLFRDTFRLTMANYHPRVLPLTVKNIQRIKASRAEAIYKERFADASDFTFFIVGNFDTDTLKYYTERYLASLPATNRKENWVDWNVNPPRGVVKKKVRKGTEPKSLVNIAFTGPFDWSKAERYRLDMAAQALSIKLRESLREEKGGTYGIRCVARTDRYPKPEYALSMSFGCNPDRLDTLVKAAFDEIERIKLKGATDTDLAKVKENLKRERETSLRTNRFWLYGLAQKYWLQDDDLGFDLAEYSKAVDAITAQDLQDVASRYFNYKNYVQVALVPEK
jgi:zinc protease